MPTQHRGVALIEFAIAVLVLLAIVFGLTEFGRAMYEYNTLVKASRDAARHLSEHAPGAGLTPPDATIAQARCLAVTGSLAFSGAADTPTCTGTPLLPTLTPSNISVCDSSNCADHAGVVTGSGTINLVTVTISGYAFSSMINELIGGVTIGAPSMTFGPISTTMIQVL